MRLRSSNRANPSRVSRSLHASPRQPNSFNVGTSLVSRQPKHRRRTLHPKAGLGLVHASRSGCQLRFRRNHLWKQYRRWWTPTMTAGRGSGKISPEAMAEAIFHERQTEQKGPQRPIVEDGSDHQSRCCRAVRQRFWPGTELYPRITQDRDWAT